MADSPQYSNRKKLHALLVDILGSQNVYFQPPEGTRMKFPAIRYARSRTSKRFADDSTYMSNRIYTITVIDRDPDSPIVDKIELLPKCEHNNTYCADGLNHDVFTIYY